MVHAVAETDIAQFGLGPGEGIAAPASSSGKATFSRAVMVGTRWKDWKTMPIWRPRKTASPSSSSAPRSWPATLTSPESGRSSPAIVISSVDLPEPEGPTRPVASPAAKRQRNTLEDMDAGGAHAPD